MIPLTASVEATGEDALVRLAFVCLYLSLAACSPPISPAPCTPASSSTAKSSTDPTGEWEVRWDRGFAGWEPSIFDGDLTRSRQVTFQRWKRRSVRERLMEGLSSLLQSQL